MGAAPRGWPGQTVWCVPKVGCIVLSLRVESTLRKPFLEVPGGSCKKTHGKLLPQIVTQCTHLRTSAATTPSLQVSQQMIFWLGDWYRFLLCHKSPNVTDGQTDRQTDRQTHRLYFNYLTPARHSSPGAYVLPTT